MSDVFALMEDTAQEFTNKTATARTNDFQGALGTIEKGTLANRPAYGNTPRYYLATDEKKVYFDTGAAWVLIAMPAKKQVKGAFTLSTSYQQVSADYDAVVEGTAKTTGAISLSGSVNSYVDIYISGDGVNPDYRAQLAEMNLSFTLVIGISMTLTYYFPFSVQVPKGKYVKAVLSGSGVIENSQKIEWQPEV